MDTSGEFGNLMDMPSYYTGSSFVGYEHCVIWQRVSDVLKVLHSYKMVINIYKLAQHNIPEDLNLNIQQHHWKNKNHLSLTPSPATSGEVKNGWNCTLASTCASQGQLTLTLLFPFLGVLLK